MLRRVGLLLSLTGDSSIVGTGQLQAALLAIEQINKSSSLTIEPKIRDDRSDPSTAAREAYSLVAEEKADVLVGCYLSSVRNSVLSALSQTGGLLLYPTLYEGGQVHPNIFYLGAVPNQQVEPLLCWTFHNVSRNFVLVGSDYVYPRSTNRQVKRWVENSGGKVLFESYFKLGSRDFGAFFTRLRKVLKPTMTMVVFSTLVGNSVPAFYAEFRKNKFSFPIISPLTSEREITLMDAEASFGHICASPYFETLDTEANREFVETFRRRFGDQPISREMMTTYGAIRLLAGAYEMAHSLPYGHDEVEKVRATLKDLSFHGPQGNVMMDPTTQHLWQWSHIGRINQQGQVDVIWSSPGPLPPKHDNPNPSLAVLREERPPEIDDSNPLIGANQKFLECVKMAKIAAKTSCNVLITGETGTGKELMARFIHLNSARKDKRFVTINCATIPRELMESELFGYDEGAFTGAKKRGKPGKFELGAGGTLFLDEIGEMPLDMQAHLLRVIEDKEICRIGGTRARHLDIRFVAATNRNLGRETMEGGSFRRDLFYRLSLFHVHLPPLRERPDDILRLADHFLQKCSGSGGTRKFFAPETLTLLQQYEWPGNARELANVVERSFHLSQNSPQIDPDHLPESIIRCQTVDRVSDEEDDASVEPSQDIYGGSRKDLLRSRSRADHRPIDPLSPSSGGFPKLHEVEEALVKRALERTFFNLAETARLLGIGRSTLYRKLKKYSSVER